MKKQTFFLAVAVIFTLFFGNILFLGKTLSTTAITPGTFAKGVFNYQGRVMKTLPLKDPGAFSWHHYPMMKVNQKAYKNGELPLWNPYVGSGQPLAANQQSGGFSPINIPLFLNSSLLTWDLFMIFRLALAFAFTFLLARKFGFSQKASLLSAIVFTFSGYFWFFITMNHLSIEIFIPAAFYFSERLLKEESIINIGGLAAIYGLALLGGMPESSFLLIAISSLYFIIRLTIKSREKGGEFALKKGEYFAISLVIGFALSSILLLPFFEYLKNAWHAHVSGEMAGSRIILKRGLSDLLIPNFSWPGPNWAEIKRHYVFHYVGVLSLLLAFSSKKKKWPNIFFACLALFYLLKLVGFPVINLIGKLPLFKSIYYPKYMAPYFAISIAILAGSGFETLKEVSLKKISLFGGIWLSGVIFILYYYRPMIIAKGATIAVAIRMAKPAVIILLFIAILVLFKKGLFKIKWSLVSTIIIFLLVAELFIYLPNDRSTRHNPQKRAPYINFLKSKMKKQQRDPFRVIGLDRVLFPNTASIFEIADVRLLDALVIKRYKDFFSSFTDKVYGAHITGHENIDFNSSMFDLTNTRYVLATDSIDSQMTSYFIRFAKPKPNYIKKHKSLIAVIKEAKNTVFNIPVPPSANGLVFKVRSKNAAKLRISTEGQNQLSSINLKPEWQEVSVKAISEGNKALSFNFNLTPEKNTEIQIAQMAYRSKDKEKFNHFKLIYDNDILIYENKNALPRAFVAYDYRELKKASSLLNSMIKGQNDLNRTILIEDKLDKDAFKKRRVEPTKVTIKQKGINSLKIIANNRFDGLLFLGENFYPGWKAYVNGKKSKIYRADYTFRAVRVPKGRNIVEFVYRPSSVKYGAIISIGGFLALIFIFGFSLWNNLKSEDKLPIKTK